MSRARPWTRRLEPCLWAPCLRARPGTWPVMARKPAPLGPDGLVGSVSEVVLGLAVTGDLAPPRSARVHLLLAAEESPRHPRQHEHRQQHRDEQRDPDQGDDIGCDRQSVDCNSMHEPFGAQPAETSTTLASVIATPTSCIRATRSRSVRRASSTVTTG